MKIKEFFNAIDALISNWSSSSSTDALSTFEKSIGELCSDFELKALDALELESVSNPEAWEAATRVYMTRYLHASVNLKLMEYAYQKNKKRHDTLLDESSRLSKAASEAQSLGQEMAEIAAYSQELLKKQLDSHEAIEQQVKTRMAKKGAAAKARKMEPIKEEAYRLALEFINSRKVRPSRRQVAIAIREDVMNFARTINKPMTGSPESILDTINDRWLRNMPEANTLFAGRHTPSTG